MRSEGISGNIGSMEGKQINPLGGGKTISLYLY
jgi:hypothetical protein